MAIRLLAVLVLLVLASGASGQTDRPISTTIEVASEMQARLPGAFVVIHWEGVDTSQVTKNIGIRQDIVGRANREGQFVAQLPEGFYDVFVAWSFTAPLAMKIHVAPGKPTLHRAVMHLEPLFVPIFSHPPVKD